MTRNKTHSKNNAKSMLGTLRTTTAVGAVSLTLAGWGVLSHIEATNAAQLATLRASADAALTAEQPSLAVLAKPTQSQSTQSSATDDLAASIPTATQIVPSTAESVALPTATPSPEPSATPTDTPTDTPTETPTETPTTAAVKYELDIVEWVQTTAGDAVAVVRDGRGTLWYVWESDVTLLEQGLSPQHQPVAVNQQGRTRGS